MHIGTWKSLLNFNWNSGYISKDREGILVGFFAVMALSGFALKKRFENKDELAYVITNQLE